MIVSLSIEDIIEDFKRAIKEFRTGIIGILLGFFLGNLLSTIMFGLLDIKIYSLVISILMTLLTTWLLWNQVKPKFRTAKFSALMTLLINIAKGKVIWPPSTYYWPQIFAYKAFTALTKRKLINQKQLCELFNTKTSKKTLIWDLAEYVLFKCLDQATFYLFEMMLNSNSKKYTSKELISMLKDNIILLHVTKIKTKKLDEIGISQISIRLPKEFRLIIANRLHEQICVEFKSRYCKLRITMKPVTCRSVQMMKVNPVPEIFGMPINSTINKEMYLKQLPYIVAVTFGVTIEFERFRFWSLIRQGKSLTYMKDALNLAKYLQEMLDWDTCAEITKKAIKSRLYDDIKYIENITEDIKKEIVKIDAIKKEIAEIKNLLEFFKQKLLQTD